MPELLSSPFFSILIRLFLALFLGGLIGLERGLHGRPAGLRTHILVCLGATIVMIIPEMLSVNLNQSAQSAWVQVDPGRMVAGIVTGIGFLGAGAIIRIGDIVRGLTTAATIWFTAALGIVIGSGHYGLAMISTALALIVLLLLDKAGHLIPGIIYRSVTVTVSEKYRESLEEMSTDIFHKFDIRIQEQSHQWFRKNEEVTIVYQIRTKDSKSSGPVVSALAKGKGVSSVIWE